MEKESKSVGLKKAAGCKESSEMEIGSGVSPATLVYGDKTGSKTGLMMMMMMMMMNKIIKKKLYFPFNSFNSFCTGEQCSVCHNKHDNYP